MLLRATIATGDPKFLEAAHKAKNFMLKPIGEGGTTEYKGNEVVFYEYTAIPAVLNGWIFSLWGLYDYCKYTQDSQAQMILEKTLETLKCKLPEYDIAYWSKYDAGRNICSPFYHKLHIAQLRVMYDLFGDAIYKEFADKWEKYQTSFWKRKRAFCKKVMQKVLE